jgi:hypothetical protein
MIKTVPADPIMFAGMTDCPAVAVENAVAEWGDTLNSFLEKFLTSGLADSFSDQEPFVTTGCTGEELVAMVNERVSGSPQAVRVSPPEPSAPSYNVPDVPRIRRRAAVRKAVGDSAHRTRVKILPTHNTMPKPSGLLPAARSRA